MIGWEFNKYTGEKESGTPFDRLLEIFKELLMYTSGDPNEAIQWLTILDRKHQLTDDSYGIGDFIEDLKRKGFLTDEEGGPGLNGGVPTQKLELALRQKALDDIFNDLKKTRSGDHDTNFTGRSFESDDGLRPYEFGDNTEDIALSESMRNAQINHGIDQFQLGQGDLEVRQTKHQSQTSTVLMIDISHSMILYGEDRITPAKRVAMALAELIHTRYPKDTLDIVVFGNDAWEVQVKDLPYLEVGPYHTNTVAGLDLAMGILQKKRNPNKQIMMITDGKPSCLKIGKKYYKNSFGLDQKIVNRTLSLAYKCRKSNIPITTFMIARDPYLMQFIDQFTKANNGKAFYSSPEGVGKFVFMDYKKNRGKKT
jgi:uncharacterized protein with von Willebrand factor type A (vWA) domain